MTIVPEAISIESLEPGLPFGVQIVVVDRAPLALLTYAVARAVGVRAMNASQQQAMVTRSREGSVIVFNVGLGLVFMVF